MSDQNDQLRDHLEQLDAELKRTQAADDNQRQHLEAMQGQVQSVLASPGGASPEDHRSLQQRLTEGLQHFEATHQALTGLIEQALNTLSAMGI
jgi:uncharacterized protein YukE